MNKINQIVQPLSQDERYEMLKLEIIIINLSLDIVGDKLWKRYWQLSFRNECFRNKWVY